LNKPPPHILPLIVLSQFAGTSLWFVGNAILPDGINHSPLLAVTTIALRGADQQMGLWRVNSSQPG